MSELKLGIICLLLICGGFLLPPDPVLAGCKLPAPGVRVELPPGVPRWANKEVFDIARLTLAEKTLDAVWRWNNLMANPQVIDLDNDAKMQLGHAVISLVKIGMGNRYDQARERVRYYLKIDEKLLESIREADLAAARLKYGRPRGGNEVQAISFPKVIGIPRLNSVGAPPVLITQVHVLDLASLKAYRADMIAKRKRAQELADGAMLDLIQPEQSLDGVMGSMAQLESAIQESLFTSRHGN